MELLEPWQLFLLGGHDDLAATLVGYFLLVAVRSELSASGGAQPRLQRARRVVDPGMDDAAVVPRLVSGDPILLLEYQHAEIGMPLQPLSGDRKSEDPCSDDDQVGRGSFPLRDAHRTGTRGRPAGDQARQARENGRHGLRFSWNRSL